MQDIRDSEDIYLSVFPSLCFFSFCLSSFLSYDLTSHIHTMGPALFQYNTTTYSSEHNTTRHEDMDPYTDTQKRIASRYHPLVVANKDKKPSFPHPLFGNKNLRYKRH